MQRFVAFALLAAAGLLSATSASAGVRPAPVAAFALSPGYEMAQFRFPWESRQKAKPRPKRGAKPQKSNSRKPAATAKGAKGRKGPPAGAAAAAAVIDPLDAKLPAAAGPLDVATPRGDTQREADGWKSLARQVAGPAEVPRLGPDGPGPAPAYVVATLAPMRVGDQTVSRRMTALAEPDDETPDRHIPLPPVRPPAPGEIAAPRAGLSPEGKAIAPEGGGLAPEGVPLPPRRPGDMAALEPEVPTKPELPAGPTEPDIPLPVVAHDDDADCRALVSEGVTEAERMPPIEGPGVCGGGPLVSLTAVKRRDGTSVKVRPAATLRCSMARELAAFLRDDVAPAAEGAGLQLTELSIAGSFQCRGRNGATAGKMSEHGRANAVDLSGFGFSDGKTFGIFAADLPKTMSDKVKSAACERFSTVLGPGSDGFHEDHLHVDLQPRRSKAKLCQWADPQVAKSIKDETDGEGEQPDDKAAASEKDGSPEPKTAARRKAEPSGAKASEAKPSSGKPSSP